jgi:hypothetical protein
MKYEDMYIGRLLWYTKPQDPDLKFPCVFILGTEKEAMVKTEKGIAYVKYRYLSPREREWQFGDMMVYKSPMREELETPCVFLRYEGDKAVVMFKNAESCARVDKDKLWKRQSELHIQMVK